MYKKYGLESVEAFITYRNFSTVVYLLEGTRGSGMPGLTLNILLAIDYIFD